MSITGIFSVMAKLLFAMAIGFLLKKKGIFSRETDSSISWAIVNITLPALILYAVAGSAGQSKGPVLLYFFVGLLLYVLILPVLCHVLASLLKVKGPERGVYEMLLMFANVSFMGIPVLQSIYGDSAVFYNSLLHMAFNLCIFTYGISLLERSQKGKVQLENLLTPGSLSCVAAMVIYFAKIPIPGPVSESLEFVGNVTTPLSMIVLGSMLAQYSFREIASNKKMYGMAFLKLLVLPAIAFLIARPIWGNSAFTGMLTLSAAMPAGTLCVMLANQKGNYVREASAGVLITTLFSVATIPLWMVVVVNF